jgi:uncharacterized membrane protein
MEMEWPEDVRERTGWRNVGHLERWLSIASGAGLAIYGFGRRDRAGLTAAALGGALLWRGSTGWCPVYAALCVDTSGARQDTRRALGGRGGILVDERVTIDAPIDELYRFWRDFENLPRFMTHLESVFTRPDGRSHWVAKGPAGTTVAWDAEIINEVPNQVIGWRSLPGSDVVSAGSVNFDSAGPGHTQVAVRLQYDPPGGKLGAAFAKLFGEDPSRQIREDLDRLKRLLETARAPQEVGSR